MIFLGPVTKLSPPPLNFGRLKWMTPNAEWQTFKWWNYIISSFLTTLPLNVPCKIPSETPINGNNSLTLKFDFFALLLKVVHGLKRYGMVIVVQVKFSSKCWINCPFKKETLSQNENNLTKSKTKTRTGFCDIFKIVLEIITIVKEGHSTLPTSPHPHQRSWQQFEYKATQT